MLDYDLSKNVSSALDQYNIPLRLLEVKQMNDINTNDISNNFLNAAYKCKPADLEALLLKIENEIKNKDYKDNNLLRAKTVVTSKLVLYYSK